MFNYLGRMTMKLYALLAASAFSTLTALSSGAWAEDKAAPAPEAKAEKAAPAPAVKPHSHVQEKTGVPQEAPAKKKANKDKTKHYHPRDK